MADTPAEGGEPIDVAPEQLASPGQEPVGRSGAAAGHPGGVAPTAGPEPAASGDPDPEDAEDEDSAQGGPAAGRKITAGIGALLPENAGPGAAAFFDIDNTIIRGSSIGALAKGMADRDYFTTAEVLEFSWKQLKFVLSGKENMEDIAEATENGLAFVKGRSPDEIRQLADEVYDETMARKLWAGSVELATAHQELGHEVWLVSATPVEVAEEIAARLGLTGGLGTVAEVVDGAYSGKLDGPPLHGEAKVAAITRLAAERGLDLARCAAYSDSSNDIPMLSRVGYPVAVNPDGALRSHAKQSGWPIRDYRLRGNEAVRKGVPAAAAAGVAVGVAVGVAKGIQAIRERGGS